MRLTHVEGGVEKRGETRSRGRAKRSKSNTICKYPLYSLNNDINDNSSIMTETTITMDRDINTDNEDNKNDDHTIPPVINHNNKEQSNSTNTISNTEIIIPPPPQ